MNEKSKIIFGDPIHLDLPSIELLVPVKRIKIKIFGREFFEYERTIKSESNDEVHRKTTS